MQEYFKKNLLRHLLLFSVFPFGELKHTHIHTPESITDENESENTCVDII